MIKLEVKDLRISFRTNNGAVRAVRDVSFELQQGKTLAIVGESGSGKSVTARAIMGILAGNAMVENGEIIYDGQDLLKISEEDYHALRGHRIAMIFQDPLSALNPIMRIGKQLTEAMLLNNKERRRDGKSRYNRMIALLRNHIIAAYAELGQDKKHEVDQKIKTLKSFTDRSIQLQTQYAAARESLIQAHDYIEEALLEMKRSDTQTVRDVLFRLDKACKDGYHPYLIKSEDTAFNAQLEQLSNLARKFTRHNTEQVENGLAGLRDIISGALALSEPSLFSIAYCLEHDAQRDLPDGMIEAINRESEERLQNEFMADFLLDVQKALAHSAKLANQEAANALRLLEDNKQIFEQTPLVEKACKDALVRTAAAVDKTIDPMRIEKDNLSCVYRTSMKTNISRYFKGLITNPKEKARFHHDTVKREKLLKRERFAPQVVPMNLVDLEMAHDNMKRDVNALIEQYRKRIDSPVNPTTENAEGIVKYLRQCSADYSYTLSKAMARHRSIELMKEVGIPEPQKRFRQYPFEFSGGMRQRIVIAIALSANPDILICDEPTTALDVTIQAQILELINRLKEQRNLSVIFITHDLGVVANMADNVAVMYAGKIVETGTADEVFYSPAHPYTWALLSSVPDLETREKLKAIPGTPPNMIIPPKGDAFAARNPYALELDFEEQPPMFKITETHSAATWLLHPDAPKIKPPEIVIERIQRMRDRMEAEAAHEGGETL